MSDTAKYLAFERNTATIDGITKTWADWCEVYGITRKAVYERMHYSPRSFETAVKGRKKHNKGWWSIPLTIEGVTKTPQEWMKEAGITRNGYYARLAKGFTVAEALTIRNQRIEPEQHIRIGKVDMRDVKGINLNLNPTPEVIEMCKNCPYADCINDDVRKCLRAKRRKEKQRDA